ncbi:probable fucosyltransferase 8 [Typha angustifolia]|uniref:probable fucosyltransferase 8 n=1 Tax=Typha angustifolia TaxID=59011 RepID=UPI003C2E4041
MDVKRISTHQQSHNPEMKGIPLRSFAFANKVDTFDAGLAPGRVTLSGGYDSFATVAAPNGNLLGGLLSPDFDEQTCLSRYESTHYRKASLHALSSYLVSKLRNCEALHKRCNPNTPLFKKSVENRKSNHSIKLECNYVLLIHQTDDLVDLFCEPFPGSTWILPSDFLIKDLNKFNLRSQQSYGNMLGKNLDRL